MAIRIVSEIMLKLVFCIDQTPTYDSIHIESYLNMLFSERREMFSWLSSPMISPLRINSAIGSVGIPPVVSVARGQVTAPIGMPPGVKVHRYTSCISERPVPFPSTRNLAVRLLRALWNQDQMSTEKS